MSTSVEPGTTSSAYRRFRVLDALRGFALFGIFFANMGVFSFYVFLSDEQQQALAHPVLDEWIDWMHEWLVHGKFYSIFSLLFGMGFYLFLRHAEAKGQDGLRFFRRRLTWLCLFGSIHLWLIWTGDILLLYALLGFVLIRFRNLRDRTLIRWIVGLWLLPLLLDMAKMLNPGFSLGMPAYLVAMQLDKLMGLSFDQIVTDNATGGYLMHLKWNTSGIFYRIGMLLEEGRMFKVFAMFLLGLLAARKEWYTELASRRRFFARGVLLLGIPGLLFGLPFAHYATDGVWFPEWPGLLESLFYVLSVPATAIGYVCAFALMYSYWPRLLSWLQPVGKMAFTNYILQSLMGMFLFTGCGLGWAGTMGPSGFLRWVLILFVCQVLFSTAWLRFRTYGPLEGIWRRLTYRGR